jgi:hypothetical protein
MGIHPCDPPGHVTVQDLLAESIGGAPAAEHSIAADCKQQQKHIRLGLPISARSASSTQVIPNSNLRSASILTAGALDAGLRERHLPLPWIVLTSLHDLIFVAHVGHSCY